MFLSRPNRQDHDLSAVEKTAGQFDAVSTKHCQLSETGVAVSKLPALQQVDWLRDGEQASNRGIGTCDCKEGGYGTVKRHFQKHCQNSLRVAWLRHVAQASNIAIKSACPRCFPYPLQTAETLALQLASLSD